VCFEHDSGPRYALILFRAAAFCCAFPPTPDNLHGCPRSPCQHPSISRFCCRALYCAQTGPSTMPVRCGSIHIVLTRFGIKSAFLPPVGQPETVVRVGESNFQISRRRNSPDRSLELCSVGGFTMTSAVTGIPNRIGAEAITSTAFAVFGASWDGVNHPRSGPWNSTTAAQHWNHCPYATAHAFFSS